MLTKQRVVMHRVPAANHFPSKEFFWEWPSASANPRSVSLNRLDWDDMGNPEVVTVTIEPGDLLNDDPISR